MNKEECLQLLKKFEGSTFINYCGVKLEDADCGWVKASMPVKKEITNPFVSSAGPWAARSAP